MNDIHLKKISPIFGTIRIEGTDKKPMFCLSDVCKALDIRNVGDCKTRLNPKGIAITDTLTEGGKQQMIFVDEANLYKCIFQSRKQEAEKFQDWVFDEVLPALRKDGGYIISNNTDTPEAIMARALKIADETLKRNEQRVRELEAQTEQQAHTIGIQQKELTVAAPKVKYYDDTLASTDCLTTTQVADDLGISARALNQQLANAGIQYFQSGSWHLKGKFREWQLASTRTYNYMKGDGSTGTKVNLVWNQRGKRFILALYNNDFNLKDAIAEINGEKRAALESKNNQSNF